MKPIQNNINKKPELRITLTDSDLISFKKLTENDRGASACRDAGISETAFYKILDGSIKSTKASTYKSLKASVKELEDDLKQLQTVA